MKTIVNNLITYYPVRSGLFDSSSAMVLNFKNGCKIASAYFERLLLKWININIISDKLVCSVPSSTAGKVNSITKTCQSLCKLNPNLIDGTNYIIKQKSHDSFCRSGKRDALILYNSFLISDNIKDKHILLIDDVTTTGLTMYILSDLLLKHGASSVTCLVLAQTFKIYDNGR